MTATVPQSVIEEEQAYAQFVEATAKACHEANKRFCESIGDNSQPSWEDASEHAKQSTYSGVLNVLQNPDVSPEHSWMNWKRDKIKAGWIYGPTKNEKARMHPNIVKKYEDLPEEQRAKDEIFIGVVQVMLSQYTKNVMV